jgi:hypothetical protein
VDPKDLWPKMPIKNAKKNVKWNVDNVLDMKENDVKIDEKNKKVEVFTNSWELIWDIFLWEFLIWDERFPHCFLEVSDKYRKMWVWRILFNTYKNNFWVLDFEYTREPDKFSFFVSVWYSAYSIINDATWEEELLYWNNDEALKILREWFSIKLEFQN